MSDGFGAAPTPPNSAASPAGPEVSPKGQPRDVGRGLETEELPPATQAALIAQEHRFTHNVYNVFRTWSLPSGDPRKSAAITALIWGLLSSGQTVALGAATLGVAGVLMTLHGNALVSAQNRLIQTSTQVTLIQARASFELELAKQSYDEINRVLSTSESVSEQVFAVERIPEAMVMVVHQLKVGPSGEPVHTASGLPATEEIYPNLVPLRERLVAFAREDRIGQRLRDLGRSSFQATDAVFDVEMQNALRPLGAISNAIVRCLYSLGRKGHPIGTASVWELSYRASRERERLTDLAGVLHASLPSRDELPPEFLGRLDLTHIRHELRGAQLPYLDLAIALSPRADMCFAQLHGARMEGAILKAVNFSSARMPHARLSGSDLRGALLGGAHLYGADLNDTLLQRAELSHAQLQGANLHGAELQGAELYAADAECAIFSTARLHGAELGRARLHGAYFNDADMVGTRLREAWLDGASLRKARMHGANLRGVRMRGARLDGAMLNATSMNLVVRTVTHGRTGNAEAYYDEPKRGEQASQVTVPGAYLIGVTMGESPIELRSDEGAYARVNEVWNTDQISRRSELLKLVRWASIDDAKKSLRPYFGDESAAMIGEASSSARCTSFGQLENPRDNANLAGVFIDLWALRAGAEVDDCERFPVELFSNAITNSLLNLELWKYGKDLFHDRANWELGAPWPPTKHPNASRPSRMRPVPSPE